MPGLSADQRKRILTLAQDARNMSYSPYSHFRVGCAFLMKDGSYVQGCNVENASYGGCICAERTAMVKAVSDGSVAGDFIALAVAADIDAPCSPCGICRQFIREFCPLDLPILMVPSSHDPSNPDKAGAKPVTETTLGELLPMSFGPEDLSRPRD